jgi:hypothetical protein
VLAFSCCLVCQKPVKLTIPSNDQRGQLYQEVERLPKNAIFVDIRPDGIVNLSQIGLIFYFEPVT